VPLYLIADDYEVRWSFLCTTKTRVHIFFVCSLISPIPGELLKLLLLLLFQFHYQRHHSSSVYIVSITDITAGSDLAGTGQHLLFSTYVLDSAWTSGELTTVFNWVSSGGVVVACCEDLSHDSLCVKLGNGITDFLSVLNRANTILVPSDPIFRGPFGNVSTWTAAVGAYWSNSGAIGATILSNNTDGNSILKQTIGSGTAYMIANCEMLSNTYIGSGTTANTDPDRLLGNIFSVPAPLYTPRKLTM
jgi:hypothetical protein